MTSPRQLIALVALLMSLSPVCLSAACACGADQCDMACTCAEAADTETAPLDEGHPLRGVVQALMPERQALLVKHEEIPGVMRAMTMMLRVAPFVLHQVEPGDTITARLHRDEDDKWYLSEVEKSTDS